MSLRLCNLKLYIFPIYVIVKLSYGGYILILFLLKLNFKTAFVVFNSRKWFTDMQN